MKSVTRGVFGALFSNDGIPAILLLQRAGNPDGTGYKGQWELPGGRQEGVESDEMTLVRKVHDETDILVSSLGEASQTFSAPAGVVTSVPDEAVVLLCEIREGKLGEFPTDSHLAARWVTLAEIMSGEIKILTNPTTAGYPSRMFLMILSAFLANKDRQN